MTSDQGKSSSHSQLRVLLTQLKSVDDPQQNIEQMLNLLRRFSSSELDLVCFPENCLYLRVQEGEKIPSFEIEDAIFSELRAHAKNHQVHLHLGSVPLKMSSKVFNSSLWIDETGGVHASYQKMHLFDIQLQGDKAIRESDVFSHGPQPRILDIKGWKLGESICYDLRFSELYQAYARAEVDALLVPSAFLVKTGEAHWHTLLRARAIESQAYVLAAAQGGTHQSFKSKGATRETYGHALAVDPWGIVLADLTDSPSAVLVNLQKSRISQVRQQIPMASHRRTNYVP